MPAPRPYGPVFSMVCRGMEAIECVSGSIDAVDKCAWRRAGEHYQAHRAATTDTEGEREGETIHDRLRRDRLRAAIEEALIEHVSLPPKKTLH